ncbi:hypothetical protein CLOM_g23196 [Closterium sp. NIES-68]|nr:hypothetical protein CLOM_g23196 [Closterium sp. NIES-68]GJP77019.1 hypothetical protein CLOP_g7453 [Closterium sp. NIES-67]
MTCQSFARWIDGTGRAVTSAARRSTAQRHGAILSRLLPVRTNDSHDQPECQRTAAVSRQSRRGRSLVPAQRAAVPRVASAIRSSWRFAISIAPSRTSTASSPVSATSARCAHGGRRLSTVGRVRAGSGGAETRDDAGSSADARAGREGFAADGIIVLAGGLKRDGTVPVWVERRLDAAAELYRIMNGEEDRAAMHGGRGGEAQTDSASPSASAPPSACRCPIVVLGAGTPHVQPVLSAHGHMWHESSACAHYLTAQHAIPPAHIYKEWASYDTVANGFFSLVWHAVPRRWQRLLVLTSAFHMPRSALIFDWIFSLHGAQIVQPALPPSRPPSLSSSALDLSTLAEPQSPSSPYFASSSFSSSSSSSTAPLPLSPLRPPHGTWEEYIPPWRQRDDGAEATGTSGEGGSRGGRSEGGKGEEAKGNAALLGDSPDHVVSQVESPGNPALQGYEIRFISASDEGIDPAMIQARGSKEADSIRLLLPRIASVRTLPAFHHYLHTDHRAYNVEHQEEFGRVKSAEEATFDPIKLCY